MLHFVPLQTVKQMYLLLFPAYIHVWAKVTFYNYKDLGQNTATFTLILKYREHFCPAKAQISLCESVLFRLLKSENHFISYFSLEYNVRYCYPGNVKKEMNYILLERKVFLIEKRTHLPRGVIMSVKTKALFSYP